jgi:G3E family GTPase
LQIPIPELFYIPLFLLIRQSNVKKYWNIPQRTMASPSPKTRIPITIITGFAGSGKTTLILNLLPQLRSQNPGYKLALIKNEIGDLNVDTQLAAAAEMTGSKELLGDCICCTNIGQIGDALATLDEECKPDRIIIETSGSAEPLKLVLEVNRLAKESGRWDLDGVVGVVDAENWFVLPSSSALLKRKKRLYY